MSSYLRLRQSRSILMLSKARSLPCILADVHCVEQPPFQNLPAEPVGYRHQINVAGRKFDICYIRWPDLIRIPDNFALQQIRIFFVILAGLGQIKSWKHCNHAESFHYAAHLLFGNILTGSFQISENPPAAFFRMLDLNFLDFLQKFKICFILFCKWRVIITSAADAQKFALPVYGKNFQPRFHQVGGSSLSASKATFALKSLLNVWRFFAICVSAFFLLSAFTP